MLEKLLRRILFKIGRKLARGGRPLTKGYIMRERVRICRANGFKPSQVKNFWTGIEELKGSICENCGVRLSQKTRKIAKGLGADYVLCKKCNSKPLIREGLMPKKSRRRRAKIQKPLKIVCATCGAEIEQPEEVLRSLVKNTYALVYCIKCGTWPYL